MALFGVHSTVWVQGFFRPWLSELMAFSYWSYYILMPLGLVLLIRERDKKLFYSYIFNLSFTLYFCYLSYIFLTARGPHETIAALHIARETAGFFDGMVRSIQEQAGVSGAAFPSSHVSATIIILIYIFRYRQWAGWLALPLVLGLILSTFYLQYHYAVDAIAGALLVFITYPAGRALEEYLRRHFGHAADERRESVNIRTIS
jgi:membrane-associated phospholipid phosphatase